MNVLNNVPLTFEEEDGDCRVCVTCRFTYPLFKFYDREHWGNQCNECRDEMYRLATIKQNEHSVSLLRPVSEFSSETAKKARDEMYSGYMGMSSQVYCFTVDGTVKDSCDRTMEDYRRVALLHKYKFGEVTERDETCFATHITAGDGVIIRDKVQPTVWKNSKYLNIAEKTKSGYKSRRNCACCIKKTTRRCERGCGAFTCADHECTDKWCIILNF